MQTINAIMYSIQLYTIAYCNVISDGSVFYILFNFTRTEFSHDYENKVE